MSVSFLGASSRLRTVADNAAWDRIGQQVSIFAWVRRTSSTATFPRILDVLPEFMMACNSVTGEVVFGCSRYTTTPYYGEWKSVKTIALPSAADPWHSIGARMDIQSAASAPQFVIDGVPSAATLATAPVAPIRTYGATQYANYGNREDTLRPLCGALAHLAVWKRVLTNAEFSAVRARGPLACPRGLVIYKPFDFGNRYGGVYADAAPGSAHVGMQYTVNTTSATKFGDPYNGRYVGAPKLRRVFPKFRTLRPSFDLANSGWVTP